RSRAKSINRRLSSSSRSTPSPVEPKRTMPSIGEESQRRRLSRNRTGATSPVTGSKGVVTGRSSPVIQPCRSSGKRPQLQLEVRRVVRRRLGDLVIDHTLGDQVHQVLVERLRLVGV